jgi:hypothetical protein
MMEDLQITLRAWSFIFEFGGRFKIKILISALGMRFSCLIGDDLIGAKSGL